MKLATVSFLAASLTASTALAEVTVTGYGRTGVVYYEDNGRLPEGTNNTQVSSRLRMDLDASTTTDSGLTFGANFRIQWDQGDAAVDHISPGQLSVKYGGLIVYVGNVVPAFDGAPLLKQTRLGVFERSWGGDPFARYFLKADKSYGDLFADRVGVALRYTEGGLEVRASYVDPDQSGLIEAGPEYEEEIALAVNYEWEDLLEVTVATAQNGAGFPGNDLYFLGTRYAVNDDVRLALNLIDNGTELPRSAGTTDGSPGSTIALYGEYDIDLVTVSGYVAHNSGDWETEQTDHSFGIGASYDLGGATLAANIQQDYEDRLYADMGVRFDF